MDFKSTVLSVRSQKRKTVLCESANEMLKKAKLKKKKKGKTEMIESNQWLQRTRLGELTARGAGKLLGSRERFYISVVVMIS